MRILALLMLSQCAHAQEISVSSITSQPTCVTRCGIRFTPAHDCEGFQETETRTLQAFADHIEGWSYKKACAAMNGWRVFIHRYNPLDSEKCRDGGFYMGEYCSMEKCGPFCAAGYTHVWSREIELDRVQDWPNTSVSHEIVHALQVGFRESIGHCFWEKRGIVRALDSATDRKQPKLRFKKCGKIEEQPRYR